MHKQIVEYRGILLSNKKEQTADLVNKMDESPKTAHKCILCDSIDRKLLIFFSVM